MVIVQYAVMSVSALRCLLVITRSRRVPAKQFSTAVSEDRCVVAQQELKGKRERENRGVSGGRLCLAHLTLDYYDMLIVVVV